MGLDLSLRSAGIVVRDGDGTIVHSQVYGFGLSKKDPESVHVGRMISIASVACKVAKVHDVQSVLIEGPAYNASGQLFHLGGLHFTVQTQLWLTHRIQAKTVPASTARKAILGAGRAPKNYPGGVKRWVADRLVEIRGSDLGEDNLNDALVLCLYAHSIASDGEE